MPKTRLLATITFIALSTMSVVKGADKFQDSLDFDKVIPEGEICFRGRPLPQCKVFFLTEFGYLTLLNKKPRPAGLHEQSRWYLTGDLGLMVNLNRKSAIGGALYAGGGDDNGAFGVLARYRRWLSPHTSNSQSLRLDLSLGPLISLTDTHMQPRTPGIAGNIGLNLGDWIAVLYHVEIFHYGSEPNFEPIKEGTYVSSYLGVKGCSYLSFVAVTLVTILVAAAWD